MKQEKDTGNEGPHEAPAGDLDKMRLLRDALRMQKTRLSAPANEPMALVWPLPEKPSPKPDKPKPSSWLDSTVNKEPMNDRFWRHRNTLTNEMKNQRIELLVDAQTDMMLDVFTKAARNMQYVAPEQATDLQAVLTQKKTLKRIFTSALEQAVYGEGNRITLPAPNGRPKELSWREHLKQGPIDFARRLEPAREYVLEQVKALPVNPDVAMQLYDFTASGVKNSIERTLDRTPYRAL